MMSDYDDIDEDEIANRVGGGLVSMFDPPLLPRVTRPRRRPRDQCPGLPRSRSRT
jgi:hypothetical protein